MIKYARGTVWFAELPDATDESTHQVAKSRPVLIVSSNNFNLNGSTVTVLPMTTKDRDLPFRVALQTSNPNKADEISYVMCDQIRNIDKSKLLTYMGLITDWEMLEVQKTLCDYLNITGESVMK